MQLDLGLKEQVRAAAPKSVRIAKTYSVQCDPGKAEAFSHHPRIERSCPNSRQRLPYTSMPPQQIPRASSLSAAAGAAVTRNVGLAVTRFGGSTDQARARRRSAVTNSP